MSNLVSLPRRYSPRQRRYPTAVLTRITGVKKRLFAQPLTKPTSPYVVGDKIREIVDNDSWQLRYPVGPDAAPFLQWRASKTDEEVISIGAASDADYIQMVKREFGLDVNL